MVASVIDGGLATFIVQVLLKKLLGNSAIYEWTHFLLHALLVYLEISAVINAFYRIFSKETTLPHANLPMPANTHFLHQGLIYAH